MLYFSWFDLRAPFCSSLENQELNMTNTNGVYESSRTAVDDHDQIGSSSTTPSGVATPRPDPSDKRLPSIMHSYFGQVRRRSCTSPPPPGSCALATPAADKGVASYERKQHGVHEALDDAPPIAPSSQDGYTSDGEDHALPLLPHERLQILEPGAELEHIGVYPLPTPPTSSSASSIHKGVELEPSTNGDAHGNYDPVDSRPASGRPESATDVIPLRTRRHTFGLSPLTNIITTSSVHAAHLSNPTAPYPSTTPSTPVKSQYAVSAHSSLTWSFSELVKLTDGVAASPRIKNTPPHTPRALSSEDQTATRSASKAPQTTSSPSRTQAEDPAANGGTNNTNIANSTIVQSIPTSSASVGPPKGKLLVRISEARGLKPSYDPYVVCVFEWNEYISRGPKQEEVDMDNEEPKGKDDLLGSVPIKRSGSDMGRAMAIPMKSRQSSTTSLSDQKNFKNGRQVTSPKWDHEAIL